MGKTPPDESGVIACLIKKCIGIIMRNLIIAASLLSTITVTDGRAAMYPVVTKIHTSNYPGYRAYLVTYTLMDIPGADIPIPSGLYVGSAVRNYYPGDPDGQVYMGSTSESCTGANSCTARARPGENLSDAAVRAFYPLRPSSTAIFYSPNNGTPPPGFECLAFVGARPLDKWSAAIYPPGTCVSAPPGDQMCRIVTPQVTLDHGVLTVNDASPRAAVKDLVVNCTAPMTVTLVFGEDVIRLGTGLQSHLTVVNQPTGGGRIPLAAGDNTISLQSDLNMTNPAGGEYSGSTVLSISYL